MGSSAIIRRTTLEAACLSRDVSRAVGGLSITCCTVSTLVLPPLAPVMCSVQPLVMWSLKSQRWVKLLQFSQCITRSTCDTGWKLVGSHPCTWWQKGQDISTDPWSFWMPHSAHIRELQGRWTGASTMYPQLAHTRSWSNTDPDDGCWNRSNSKGLVATYQGPARSCIWLITAFRRPFDFFGHLPLLNRAHTLQSGFTCAATAEC